MLGTSAAVTDAALVRLSKAERNHERTLLHNRLSSAQGWVRPLPSSVPITRGRVHHPTPWTRPPPCCGVGVSHAHRSECGHSGCPRGLHARLTPVVLRAGWGSRTSAEQNGVRASGSHPASVCVCSFSAVIPRGFRGKSRESVGSGYLLQRISAPAPGLRLSPATQHLAASAPTTGSAPPVGIEGHCLSPRTITNKW